jgi:DNA-directed RNA polymerase alpha subunit
MSENDYRELFLALRRQPHLARQILDELRKNPAHLRYGPALLDVRRRGTTLRQVAEDFIVGPSRVAQIQARFERLESWEQSARAAMEQDPTETPISLLGLDDRVTKALEGAGMRTVKDIAARSDADLLAVHDLGRKGLQQVHEVLAHFGLRPASTAGPYGAGPTLPDLTAIRVDMWMDVRSANALMSNGVLTIADLVTLTGRDLRRFRNLGTLSLARIRRRLASHGLALAKKR